MCFSGLLVENRLFDQELPPADYAALWNISWVYFVEKDRWLAYEMSVSGFICFMRNHILQKSKRLTLETDIQ